MARKKKRKYHMGARAQSASETRERVLDAAMICFGSETYENVSLRRIADEADVGLQTVIRAGNSKEDLFVAVAERMMSQLLQRLQGIPDDPQALLRFLVDLYEDWGERMIRLMAQEGRIPAVRAFTQQNRMVQRLWIERYFRDTLEGLSDADRNRRIVSLMAITGGHTWYVLRRTHQLSPEETTLALREMIDGITGPQVVVAKK